MSNNFAALLGSRLNEIKKARGDDIDNQTESINCGGPSTNSNSRTQISAPSTNSRTLVTEIEKRENPVLLSGPSTNSRTLVTEIEKRENPVLLSESNSKSINIDNDMVTSQIESTNLQRTVTPFSHEKRENPVFEK